jgi:hypothetical protein
LAALVSQDVEDSALQRELLEKLTDLKAETKRRDYLEKATKFVASAVSLSHSLGRYVKALYQKAETLLP